VARQLLAILLTGWEEVRNAPFFLHKTLNLKKKSLKEYAPFTDEWDSFIPDNLKHFERWKRFKN
jgi:hypothetical protein